LPNNEDDITYEIQKNKKIISDITGKQENNLVHFCYPSGIWNKEQLIILNKLGILSATTLDVGLNTIEANPLSLKRIHCVDSKPLIIFEAEITGFDMLIRNKLNSIIQKITMPFK
jgi:hypothetical protein